MIEPGDIFEKAGERIVVVAVREPTHKDPARAAIHFEMLPSASGVGGAYIGRGALGRFIGDWGQPVAKMSVAGAYKLYQREREKSNRLEATVERLRHQISELG